MLQIKKIQLASIDFDDDTFCVRPGQPPVISDTMKDSVVGLGLLHAPVVREKYADAFQIVAGRKRLLIVRDMLKARSCNCLLLPAATPMRTVFAILLEEALSCGMLSLVGKALFFKKAAGMLGEQAASEFLPRLGLAPHPYHIKRLLGLLDLEGHIIASIEAGRLDELVAMELAGLPFKDRMLLHEIILELGLSVGNQKKLVACTKELSRRQRTAIADIMADEQLQRIRTDPAANAPQKAAQLMAWLAARRSPRLHEAERQFRKFTGSLHLPAGATINHALSFENDGLTLSLAFKDREEFLRVWEKIKGELLSKRT